MIPRGENSYPGPCWAGSFPCIGNLRSRCSSQASFPPGPLKPQESTICTKAATRHKNSKPSFSHTCPGREKGSLGPAGHTNLIATGNDTSDELSHELQESGPSALPYRASQIRARGPGSGQEREACFVALNAILHTLPTHGGSEHMNTEQVHPFSRFVAGSNAVREAVFPPY